MANYPNSAPSFGNKSNGQVIDASHINSLQDEVVAIGGGLLNGTAPVTSSNVTAAQISATAQPNARCFNSVAQSLPSSGTTALTWDSEDFDVGGVHSTAATPTRFTVPAGSSGLWLVTVSASPLTQVAARFALEIWKNSSLAQKGMDVSVSTNSGNIVTLGASALLRLNVADYVEARMYHSHVVSLNTSTDLSLHSMAACKLY